MHVEKKIADYKKDVNNDLKKVFRCVSTMGNPKSLESTPISFSSLNNFFPQLNTEWAQVEVINLINDGSGLGFGIIGGRSTGVVVKTILPGGVADRVNYSLFFLH